MSSIQTRKPRDFESDKLGGTQIISSTTCSHNDELSWRRFLQQWYDIVATLWYSSHGIRLEKNVFFIFYFFIYPCLKTKNSDMF